VQEESVARFPNAQELASQPTSEVEPAERVPLAVEPVIARPILTIHNDGDVSLSTENPQPAGPVVIAVSPEEGIPTQHVCADGPLSVDEQVSCSPNLSEADSEVSVPGKSVSATDVFGPSGLVQEKRGKKKGKRNRPISDGYCEFSPVLVLCTRV
jgi:hypothetical protein